LAVGFAQGERQTPPLEEVPPGIRGSVIRELVSETSTYVVRQKEAHAWPEVYFPGLGWVIFEPTVSQPPLFRPSGEAFSSSEQNQPDISQNDSELIDELNNLNPNTW
jgi:transglutaminase-like putative cysteine protease